MIAFWSGKAISDNRRIIPGKQGRFVSNPAYRAFKESVAWECKAHGEYFDCPVSVRLTIAISPRMDAQDVIKPVLDALELAGVIRNDRQVKHFQFHREPKQRGEQDRITIYVTEAK
jgi:Holliday junction resolvase RusA-like endonuclease